MQVEDPLVSIVVLTYNSSEYVIETLESAKAQIYPKIELIVSDDCSTDDTVEICKFWIEKNKDRFVKTHLITTRINTGISANCNRGIKSSKGVWIKVIAGDDALIPIAIKEFVDFVLQKACEICCSKLDFFGEDQLEIKNTGIKYGKFFNKMQLPFYQQQKLINKQLFIPGPGIFYSRKLIDLVEGYDERFPMGEEWPFYTKVFKKGIPIEFLDKELVKYRVCNTSASRGHKFGISKGVFDSTKDFFFKVRLKYMLKNFMYFRAWHETLNFSIMIMKFENKNKIQLYLVKSLYLLDPITLNAKCRKIFNL